MNGLIGTLLATDQRIIAPRTMRIRLLTYAALAAAISACGSDSSTEPPDVAVGTYDKQAVGESRSANCGGTIGTVVNGVLYLSEDKTWTKADVNTTPSGSPVCGFIGGTWVRDNTTTITLSPGLPGLNPVQATIAGDDLTLQFPTDPVAYKRRR